MPLAVRVYGRNEPGFEAPPARAALAPGAHDQDVGARAEQLLRRGLLRAAQALLFEVRRRGRGVRVDSLQTLFEQLAHGLLDGLA